MSIPKISLVAFKERQGGFIFVAIPNERGRYVRTDASVAHVACPQCRATVGEPCKGRHGTYNSGTHYGRRNDFTHSGLRRVETADVVVESNGLVFPEIAFPEEV
ncbi:MAG: hypothetical protein JSS14_22160 [Proteobacteria bacterium]|nr:hypothetical protein [Pseudomonadota bacterium]